MADIVERLRDAHGWAPVKLYREAADELDRLRGLLRQVAVSTVEYSGPDHDEAERWVDLFDAIRDEFGGE